MGFYVDTAEMRKAVDEYQTLSRKAQEQLNSAKNSMNGIINSNAMYGQVGQAIAADINNNQNAVIVGLQSSYSAIEMELRQAYQDFKSTTGESSDSAVISEEALTKAKTDIDKLKETHQEKVKDIQSVYDDISDLISLTAPKSEFDEVAEAAKKYVDEIIKKVNEFDNKKGNATNEAMLQSLGKQIKAAEKVGGLGYTDPQFLTFANSTGLAENVQTFNKNVTETSEKLLKEKEKDLNSMSPSEMIAKYGVDDVDVKKRMNDISNGISTTSLGVTYRNVKKAGKDGMENIVFPVNRDVAMGLSEEWLKNNGDLVATGLYNTGTKYFGGSEVASGFYAGAKIVGAAGKAMPIIGAAIDYGTMIASGESANDAAAKTGAHFITGVGIGLGVAALGLSGGWAIVAGVGAAWLINEFVVDPIYDITKKVVGDAINSAGKWVGNLFK